MVPQPRLSQSMFIPYILSPRQEQSIENYFASDIGDYVYCHHENDPSQSYVFGIRENGNVFLWTSMPTQEVRRRTDIISLDTAELDYVLDRAEFEFRLVRGYEMGADGNDDDDDDVSETHQQQQQQQQQQFREDENGVIDLTDQDDDGDDIEEVANEEYPEWAHDESNISALNAASIAMWGEPIAT